MKLIVRAIALLFVVTGFSRADGQTTAFIYQGSISTNGNPMNGTYDIRFSVFATPTGGERLDPAITNRATVVSDGVFVATLDFGSGVFTGPDRWLEIGVRSPASFEDYVTLAPRQPITSAPYAIRAREAGIATAVSGAISASQITGTLSPALIAPESIGSSMLQRGSVTSEKLAAGAVTADQFATGVSAKTAMTFPSSTGSNYVGKYIVALGTSRFVSIVSKVLALFPFGVPPSGGNTPDRLKAELQTGLQILSQLLIVGGGRTAQIFDMGGKLLASITNDTDTASGQIAAMGTNQWMIGSRLYSLNGTLLKTFAHPSPSTSGTFGAAVAAVGTDKVVIGDPTDAGRPTRSGAAYLYSTGGTLMAKMTEFIVDVGDQFGAAVAGLGNDRVLVGAPGKPYTGSAYLFDTNGTFLVTFRQPVPARNSFGRSVAAVGPDRALIGAGGIAYLFARDGTRLATFTDPNPSRSGFGSFVAASGANRVIVAASSAVYLFAITGELLGKIFESGSGTSLAPISVAPVGYDSVLVAIPATFLESLPARTVLLRLQNFIPGLAGDGALAGTINSESLADGAVTLEKLGPSVGTWIATGTNIHRAGGRVGIGTNAPAATLHVKAPQNASLTLESASGDTDLTVASGLSSRWSLRSSVATNGSLLQLVDRTAGDKTRLAIDSAGNVGIGVSNPRFPLQVNGTIAWGGAQLHSDQGGSIELGSGSGQPGASPYIDFHYGLDNNRSQNYNVRLVNDGDGQLTINGNLRVTGTIAQASDREVKRDFAPVNPREILDKITRLPIQTWSYAGKVEVRHAGPVAQEFRAAFGLGEDDRHIATVDADGVALLAIQGLNQKLEEKNREIERFGERLRELEALVNSTIRPPGPDGKN